MSIQVIMPQLGESVVEGTVTQWLIAEGQPVTKDDSLLEFSTDKIEGELLAPASGILSQILVADGQTVDVGTVLGVIEERGSGVRSQGTGVRSQEAGDGRQESGDGSQGTGVRSQESGNGSQESGNGSQEAGDGSQESAEDIEAHLTVAPALAQSTVSRPTSSRLGFISPAVGRLAAEHGLDLTQIVGTGEGGRITKKDVEAFIAARPVTQSAGLPPVATQRVAAHDPDTAVPLSPMRRAIAQRMTHSRQATPQATTVMEADLTRVVGVRERLREEFAQQGAHLTFTPFFVQAIVAGLQAVPEANSSFREDALLIHQRMHIGVAVALSDGLIVPVIRDAHALSLLGLARAVNDLAERARRRQLAPDEAQGGTFTLTNHGTAGSLFATPIIVPPQAGILGVGAIQKRPVVISRGHPLLPDAEDAIAIRPLAYLSFTFDHRVLDGQGADRFLGAVKGFLENYQA